MRPGSSLRITARVPALALAATASLVFTGCHGPGDASAPPGAPAQATAAGDADRASTVNDTGDADDSPAIPEALVGTWWAVAIRGEPVTPPGPGEVMRAMPPSMIIGPRGKLAGTTGVNRWFGQVDAAALAEGRWSAGPIGTTRRAGPPEAMALEQRFLEAIENAGWIEKLPGAGPDGRDIWLLLDDTGAEVLRLGPAMPTAAEPDPVPEPLAGRWVLVAIEGKPLDPAADEPGRRPTMTIAPSGRLTGDGGVNAWFSSLDAEALAEGRFEREARVGSTLMAGPGPAMELERRFHRLLSAATNYDATTLRLQDVLILRGDDPGELLRFERRAE